MNKKLVLFLLFGLFSGAAVTGVVLWGRLGFPGIRGGREGAEEQSREKVEKKQTPKPASRAVRTKEPRAAALPKKPKLQFTNSVPPAFRQDVENLRAALDVEDRGKIVEAVTRLLASDRSDIRVEATDALCYAGWEGLSLLTTLLIDEDPEVADSARKSFDYSLFDIENSKTKQKLLSAAAELVAPVDPGYFNELVMDYSMEVSDNEAISLVLGLYNENLPEESKNVIFQTIQDITFSDPITSIEQGKKETEKWRDENKEWIQLQDSQDWGTDF